MPAPTEIKVNYLAVRDIKAWTMAESDFTIDQAKVQIVSGGTPGSTTQVLDRFMTAQTAATVTDHAQVTAAAICTYRSANPAIATVDPDGGFVTRIANGNVRILADGPRMTKSVLCNMLQTGGQATSTHTGYASGSLAKKLSDDLDARLVGKTVAINGPCFTSFNPWTRNPNNWAAGVDLSPLSIYNNCYYTNSSPTLITPRHFIQCHHYQIPGGVGNWVQYCSDDGTNRICQREVIAAKYVLADPAKPNSRMDMWIGVLDSDVDGFIGHVKFLPSNWQSKLPSIYVGDQTGGPFYTIPFFMQDKNKGAWVYNWYEEWLNTIYQDPTWQFYYSCGTQPKTGSRAPWLHYLVGGDSGSSGCLILDNQLVILMPIGGGSGWGPSCHMHSDRITATINELPNSGGHAIEFVNLIPYPSFP